MRLLLVAGSLRQPEGDPEKVNTVKLRAVQQFDAVLRFRHDPRTTDQQRTNGTA